MDELIMAFSPSSVEGANGHSTAKHNGEENELQVRDMSLPVMRSLSGPSTVCSPSASNSTLSVWELMSRFRVCP